MAQDAISGNAKGEASPRMKAAQIGSKRFQGNPCKRCQSTERFTSSGGCVRCTNETSKARHQQIRALLSKVST